MIVVCAYNRALFKVIIYKSRDEPFMKQKLRFGLLYGRPAVLNISAIKLKYAPFIKQV